MKYKVNFITDAETDLFEIYKYIYLNDSEESAEKIYNKLLQKCLTLHETPERGNVPPELRLIDVDDFLEIHSRPYRIVYQVIDKEVFIHCILDGRRNIQKLLQERILRS